MFGKWYDGEGNEIISRCPDLCRIETSHERVHALSKEAVAAASRGDKRKTLELYEQTRRASREIVDILDSVICRS